MSRDTPLAQVRRVLDQSLALAGTQDLSWIGHPLPSDGWTLAPDALRFLSSLVACLQPRHILEFGSGLSTRVMARAGTHLAIPCCVSSIDHDPEFGAEASRNYFESPEPNCSVAMQIAPLVARECGGKLLPTYLLQRERLASELPVDLVVIDGPTAVLGGREGTLYQSLDFARPGTLVLLDDAARREESAAVAHWIDNLGDAIQVVRLHGFVKGMAAIIVRDPIRCADLFAHRLRLTRADLENAVPDQGVIALAGDDWWRDDVKARRATVPFLERDGQNWGAPADDTSAIGELERLRARGVSHVAFGWPSFWWFDCYPALQAHLFATCRAAIENDRVVLYALNEPPDANQANGRNSAAAPAR